MWSLVCLCLLSTDPLTAGDHPRELKVGELDRSYLVHLPSKVDVKQPTPVVLIFHGALSNARQMVRFCGLNEKADQVGFIAVYPEATGRAPTWNAGDCCGGAVFNKVDEVAFVRAVLEDLAQVVTIDKQRIYATGMSNGAMLCYRLANEMSDEIAAIAPVGGAMAFEKCSPTRPVSVMHFHGTEDNFAPFKGRPEARGQKLFRFTPVAATIEAWVAANGCPAEGKETALPDEADDGLTVSQTVYGPGKDQSEVILFSITGGGHTWPGRQLPLGRLLGKSTKDISANDLIWEFFEKHPLK